MRPVKFFSSSKVTLNCGLFLSLLIYWLASWRSNSVRGETTFSNEVHIVNSTSSGFSRETACAFLSWSKLESVCVCICFFCTLSWIFYHNILFLCQWCFHISIFTIRSHSVNFIVPNVEDFNFSSNFCRLLCCI